MADDDEAAFAAIRSRRRIKDRTAKVGGRGGVLGHMQSEQSGPVDQDPGQKQ